METETTPDPAQARISRWRMMLRLGLLPALAAALYLGGQWAVEQVELLFMPLYQDYGLWAMAAVVAVYIVLMSLPFVPGIEISLALLMIFKVDGVAVVYGSTWCALTLSFLVGRLIPLRTIARLAAWLHLRRTRELLERLAPLEARQRLNLLVERAPLRLIPFLLRHRYLAVAAAFNLPGNALIGGGGGIALVAGISGLFRIPAYMLMVAIAISPIPLAMLANHWLW